MKTTTKKPVAFEPDVFTVIRDGKIEKQESPTADKEEGSGSGKK